MVRIDGKVCDAVADEISRAGVSLSGELPMPESDTIEVTIRSTAGDLRLTTTAQVTHAVNDEETGETHLGVEFASLTDEQHRVLDDMVSRVAEGMSPAPLQALPPGAGPDLVRKALDAIPLPHRIQMARKALPREREFLRQDPSPPVLDALARNPNITLPEVKVLARMPLILPATVEAMADDPRWRRDEELKILLATHPRVSLQVAERLAFELDLQGMRRLLQKPGLHDAVKGKLRARMSDREMKGW